MDGSTTDLPILAYVFWGVLTFSLIVVVHEMGHFATARAFGVKVHEFVIGLPGPMLRLRTKSTTFGISMVPLGGYVRIAGMEPGEDDPLIGAALTLLVDRGGIDVSSLASELGIGIGRAQSLLASLSDWGAAEPVSRDGSDYLPTTERKPDESDDSLLSRVRSSTYRGRPIWQRIVILGTGVFLNLLFAILTFSVVLSVWGYTDTTTTIERAIPDTPAARAGFESGDVIVGIDGDPVEQWATVLESIDQAEAGTRMVFSVTRDGADVEIPVILTDQGPYKVGIESRLADVRLPFFTAVGESIRWTGLVFVALFNLFRPDTFASTIEGARGVVGVSVEAAQAASRGPIDYAWMLALLSLSLGALNIFPIPPLDGGKIVLELVGMVRGRPVSRNWYMGLTAVGALLIFSLIGYLVYADTIRYVFS